MRTVPHVSIAAGLVILGWTRLGIAADSPPPVTTPPAATNPTPPAAASKETKPVAATETKPAAAKDTPAVGPLPGHSSHGEAFNEGPRQHAYLMAGMGPIKFPIAAKTPEIQAFFNQGVGQLHGFWYYEAERSFRQVAALDPDCAMAYWGLAAANVNNESRAKTFIAEATKRRAQAGPREQKYIDAWATYYKEEKKDKKDRRRKLVRDLESIIQEFPDDIEAKALLAVYLWQNAGEGLPINSHQAVDALIQQIFAVEPMHSAHHFRIHLWDDEKASIALTSAAKCGQAAPGIAHMWHMSGHIYSRVHRYADAAWQQEAATRVDFAYMIRDRVLPDQIHNFAHNNEWLIRDLSNVGRARDGVALAKNMVEIPRHPKINPFPGGGTAHYGRERLLQLLYRFEMWDELLALSEGVHLEPTSIHNEQIGRLRARGVAYFQKGNVDQGKAELEGLKVILAKEKADQQAAGEQAEKKARDEKKPEDQIAKAKQDAIKAKNNRIEPIDEALTELRALRGIGTNDLAAARQHLEKVNGVGKHRLARYWLQAGDKEKAEKLAREEVEFGQNQAQPLANYASILWQLDKKEQAVEQFKKLLPLSKHVDLDLPVFQRLKPLAQSLNLSDDWRDQSPEPTDVGVRPPLDSLGPLGWRPSPAAPFTLTDGAGKPLALESYRGKPVVVIFYLGYGCLHCVEQLQAFAPMTKEFADAGISLVAVSTDAFGDLKKSVDACKAEGGFPFPLVSDAGLETFKSYRCHDDFEKKPLHGTFLIDGRGLVRWQDIGYQPFMDAKYLLEESKRLLKIPTP